MIDLLGGVSDPVTEAAAIGAAGAIALTRKRWRTALLLLAAAGAWAYLAATPSFAAMLWRGLVDQYPYQPPASRPHAAAIVLVGGGPVPKPPQPQDAATHLEPSTPLGVATALYRTGKAPTLVAIANYATPAGLAAIVRQGVPRSAIRPEPASQTTHQDALYSRSALRTLRDPSILLVTAAEHMPRTVATFRKQGFHVTPTPAPPQAQIARWPRSLRPSRAGIRLTRNCLHEYIGLLFYRLRGWATW